LSEQLCRYLVRSAHGQIADCQSADSVIRGILGNVKQFR